MSSVLLVTTRKDVTSAVTQSASTGKNTVLTVESLAEAQNCLALSKVDVIAVDLECETGSGMLMVSRLKSCFGLPILAFSTRHDFSTRIDAFDLGADDFLLSPFEVDEFHMRCSSLQHRCLVPRVARYDESSNLVVVGELKCNFDSFEFFGPGGAVSLSPRAYELLRYFVLNPGRTVSREMLLREVWASRSEWQTLSTVTEHVRKLRGALRDAGVTSPQIVSVRGFGYRLDLDG